MDSRLPLIDGMTETAPEGEPLSVRLSKLLAQRPGGSREKVAEGLSLIEDALGDEGDEKVRARIAAGVAMIRGLRQDDGEPRSSVNRTSQSA